MPLSIEIVTAQIIAAAEGRFEVSKNDQLSPLLMRLAKGIEEKQVFRLRRVSNQRQSWRTILVAVIPNIASLENALKWAASVRELLLNNESADLYLLILSEGVLKKEHCINIEADERYCRKYVLRPNETIADLLNRCFLHRAEKDAQIGTFTDPLAEALVKTGANQAWFTPSYQEQWETAFLSGKSGLELAEMLFDELQEDIQ